MFLIGLVLEEGLGGFCFERFIRGMSWGKARRWGLGEAEEGELTGFVVLKSVAGDFFGILLPEAASGGDCCVLLSSG